MQRVVIAQLGKTQMELVAPERKEEEPFS